MTDEINDKTGQVVSKQRVSDHGEVFTAKREVNAMLDLVNRKPNGSNRAFWSQRAVRETSLPKFLKEN